MALRDSLLPIIDRIRSIPGRMGLHRYRVYVRVTTYSGDRVGTSAGTQQPEIELLVGGLPPHVREVRSKDLVAGDTALRFKEFEIGPLTPNWAGGGTTDAMVGPQYAGQPAKIHYRIVGPGLPATGMLCQRTDDSDDRPFRTMVRVRTTGRAAP